MGEGGREGRVILWNSNATINSLNYTLKTRQERELTRRRSILDPLVGGLKERGVLSESEGVGSDGATGQDEALAAVLRRLHMPG